MTIPSPFSLPSKDSPFSRLKQAIRDYDRAPKGKRREARKALMAANVEWLEAGINV